MVVWMPALHNLLVTDVPCLRTDVSMMTLKTFHLKTGINFIMCCIGSLDVLFISAGKLWLKMLDI